MSYNPPGKKARKRHPADIHHDEQVARAVGFTVHFRKGPQEKYQEAAATLAGARLVETQMNARHGEFGRRAVVYAINPEGVAFPVSPSS